MKKVAIIGASGMAGREIYRLADQENDWIVTGIVRDDQKAHKVLGKTAHLFVADVLAMPIEQLTGFDVIVDAFGTAPVYAGQQVTLAKKLVEVAHQSQVKLIFILGAGSLHTGEDRHLVMEDLAKTPNAETWINTPRQQKRELDFLQGVDNVDWLGISPSITFKAGPATDYELGQDDLLGTTPDKSVTTAGTMAKLIVSEIKTPAHHGRITVVNKA
ncbi:NAD(P)H-binding protein [Lactobacillus alvi]|uniref:NAD(P)H-binding protein n=1 Tax=Limosilactobacillus alvi TaxID=990412 RepID=A0ABS2ELL8_9LACO|nr:NAD(P)H-binding protein [Limosilactobacillus alvi]MBM6753402.1 NAD(P)H-binding protein [Limosilactobacillus alvi]